MARVSRAFDDISNRGGLPSRPTPANDPSGSKPWAQLQQGELPPMMFQLRFYDGQALSLSYSDIRQIRCRDAGYIEILLYAPKLTNVVIEGRHLRELASLLGCCLIRWVEECNERQQIPESAPEVTSISIEMEQ
ncbi:MAG: hypothetical protein R3C53_19030 [Pirellulaceae bacterium]